MGFRHNFIIGLGGTGGNAVKAFKEVTVERDAEYAALKAAGRRFEYLYIDSNDVDINNAAEWKHLDTSIGLIQGTESLLISVPPGSNAGSYVGLPNVRAWIGGNAGTQLTNAANAMTVGNIQGAGQRRRYGRLLAASHDAAIRNHVIQGIARLSNGLTGNDRKVTFHVFATLGGGTGSGSIVDMLTLIPELCNNHSVQYKIIAYLFVGAGSVSSVDVGFFYQNEYTALRDINALMGNTYRPYRAFIPSATHPFHDKADPVDAVYISTEENGVELSDQVKRFASSCFDLVAFVPCANSNTGRAFSGEDLYPANPGESSKIAIDPLTKERVVVQYLPMRNGAFTQVDRSYRFQTLSSVRAKHPVKELHGILAGSLGKQVIERWLNGEMKYRDRRDTSYAANKDIFSYDGNTDAYLKSELDDSFRKDQLKKFDEMIQQIEETGYDASSLKTILDETTALCNDIQRTTETDVQRQVNKPESDVERICRQQAKADRDAIIETLELRRKWTSSSHSQGTVWGIKDMIAYLESLKTELQSRGVNGVPKYPVGMGNMGRRTSEWDKLGILTFRTTRLPQRMMERQTQEGRSYVEQYCDIRLDAIRRVRNRILVDLLNADIYLYQQGGRELELASSKLEEVLTINRNRLGTTADNAANPELHDCADYVSVWSEDNLKRHVDYYDDTAQNDADITAAMIQCEADFADYVVRALDLVQPVVGRTESKAQNLVMERLLKGTLSTQSEDIHERLCNLIGVKRYPKAFAKTIYDYLSDKDPDYLQDLTDSVMHKVAVSANITPNENGGPTQNDTGIQPGPWKAACLGMSAAPNANQAHAVIKDRLSRLLQGKSNPGRFHDYQHGDETEIRVCYTNFYMPLRFFSVVKYLADRYCEKGTEALYFPNIDDDGMKTNCPNRPDLLPEQDPEKLETLNNERQSEKLDACDGLKDTGEWEAHKNS